MPGEELAHHGGFVEVTAGGQATKVSLAGQGTFDQWEDILITRDWAGNFETSINGTHIAGLDFADTSNATARWIYIILANGSKIDLGPLDGDGGIRHYTEVI